MVFLLAPCRLPGYIRRDSGAFAGEKMKINIDEITYEEMQDVIARLREMKIESRIRRFGSSVILQTEEGPVHLPQAEAIDILGVPAMMF